MKDDLTVRKRIKEMMDTEYGLISFKNWCQLEVKRIRNKNVHYKENDGMCWLSIEKGVNNATY